MKKKLTRIYHQEECPGTLQDDGGHDDMGLELIVLPADDRDPMGRTVHLDTAGTSPGHRHARRRTEGGPRVGQAFIPDQ